MPATSFERHELHGYQNFFNTGSSRFTSLVELPAGECAKFTKLMSLPTHVIPTDASRTGWGAQMNQMSIHGLWTGTKELNHIIYLELFSIGYHSRDTSHCVASAGQYNCCRLPLERMGHTVQIPALSSSRDSDLGLSTQDIATAKLPIGSDERASPMIGTFEGVPTSRWWLS